MAEKIVSISVDGLAEPDAASGKLPPTAYTGHDKGLVAFIRKVKRKGKSNYLPGVYVIRLVANALDANPTVCVSICNPNLTLDAGGTPAEFRASVLKNLRDSGSVQNSVIVVAATKLAIVVKTGNPKGRNADRKFSLIARSNKP